MNYGGFWRRFGAYWLDVIILLPLIFVTLWLSTRSKYFYAWYFLPGSLITLWYHVYLVRRFGGTPGKLLMKLRICKVDGQSVGYKEAALRYLVLLILSSVQSIAVIISALHMTDATYVSLGFMARSQALVAGAPSWYRPVNVALQVWIWSEFLVLLTNKKRRELHDFMAGTVVIRQQTA
jgi:uncharacterized RDD family membrane protein YckC